MESSFRHGVYNPILSPVQVLCILQCYLIYYLYLFTVPDGTDHWMDSTLYEVFILSNQSVNTPILNISLISSDQFQTNNFTNQDLVTDITFTLIGSCPYFYFTNMLKEEASFENYYDLYIPDEIETVKLALAETVPPDDYEMEVTVTNGGTVLQRRTIIVHVRDVPPCNRGPGE